MMGKTHYVVGMAVAVAVTQPKDVKECLIALAAGALGGVFADIDTVDDDYKCDALIGQLLAYVTMGITFLIDFIMHLGILDYIINNAPVKAIVGLAVYIVVAIVGFFTDHRTFTHSFLALILSLIGIYLIYVPFSLAYAAGYLSHLGLDLLNKKKVPLLFPIGKGVCLGWCYANKVANKVFMILGFVATVVLITVNVI